MIFIYQKAFCLEKLLILIKTEKEIMVKSYIRDNSLHSKEEKNKIVILKKDKKTIVELNELGLAIWQLLKTKKTLKQLVSKIMEEYKGNDEEEIRKDVVEFISHCLSNSIVKEI